MIRSLLFWAGDADIKSKKEFRVAHRTGNATLTRGGCRMLRAGGPCFRVLKAWGRFEVAPSPRWNSTASKVL